MSVRESLGRALTPQGGRVELVREDDARLVLYVDGLLLMTSDGHASEIALAEIGCATLAPGARVLVGGLGLGYTLRAVLDALPEAGEVICVELLEPLVRWHREGLLAPQVGHVVRDPRTQVVNDDLVAYLRSQPDASFDAVLLDVDNGPIAMTVPGNSQLYDDEGIATLKRLLRPGGVLVVWSAEPAPRFLARLDAAGLHPESIEVNAASSRGEAVHHLLIGCKPRGDDTA